MINPRKSILFVTFKNRRTHCHSTYYCDDARFSEVIPGSTAERRSYHLSQKRKKFRSCCLKHIIVFCMFLWTPFLPNFSKRSKRRCCWVTKHDDFPSGGINDLHFGAHSISGWRPWQARFHQGFCPLGACWPVTTRPFPMGPQVPARARVYRGLQACALVSSTAFPPNASLSTCVFPLSDSPAAGPAAARPRSGGRTACGSTRSTSGWTTT